MIARFSVWFALGLALLRQDPYETLKRDLEDTLLKNFSQVPERIRRETAERLARSIINSATTSERFEQARESVISNLSGGPHRTLSTRGRLERLREDMGGNVDIPDVPAEFYARELQVTADYSEADTREALRYQPLTDRDVALINTQLDYLFKESTATIAQKCVGPYAQQNLEAIERYMHEMMIPSPGRFSNAMPRFLTNEEANRLLDSLRQYVHDMKPVELDIRSNEHPKTHHPNEEIIKAFAVITEGIGQITQPDTMETSDAMEEFEDAVRAWEAAVINKAENGYDKHLDEEIERNRARALKSDRDAGEGKATPSRALNTGNTDGPPKGGASTESGSLNGGRRFWIAASLVLLFVLAAWVLWRCMRTR